jgi:hypothetical protein
LALCPSWNMLLYVQHPCSDNLFVDEWCECLFSSTRDGDNVRQKGLFPFLLISS